jgi:hypothetical protein
LFRKIKVFCEKVGMVREPNISYEILLCSVINQNCDRLPVYIRDTVTTTNKCGRNTKDNFTSLLHQAGLLISVIKAIM